jgi:hypothetical protein
VLGATSVSPRSRAFQSAPQRASETRRGKRPDPNEPKLAQTDRKASPSDSGVNRSQPTPDSSQAGNDRSPNEISGPTVLPPSSLRRSRERHWSCAGFYRTPCARLPEVTPRAPRAAALSCALALAEPKPAAFERRPRLRSLPTARGLSVEKRSLPRGTSMLPQMHLPRRDRATSAIEDSPFRA